MTHLSIIHDNYLDFRGVHHPNGNTGYVKQDQQMYKGCYDLLLLITRDRTSFINISFTPNHVPRFHFFLFGYCTRFLLAAGITIITMPTFYPTPSETSEDTTIDTLLAAPVQPQDDDTTVRSAKDALKFALETEPLSVIREGDELFVANKRSERYLQVTLRYEQLASKVEMLEKEVSSLHHRDEAQQLEITSLTTMIDHLKEQNAKQRLIRNRFLTFFKRDIGKDLTSEDNRVIRDGNALAHDGDVWSDSLLYSPPNPRRDMSVFIQLYGVDPATISHIRKFTTNPEPIEV
jgi:hypothetical protein